MDDLIKARQLVLATSYDDGLAIYDHFATPATAEFLYQPPRYALYHNGAFSVGHPADQKRYGDWID